MMMFRATTFFVLTCIAVSFKTDLEYMHGKPYPIKIGNPITKKVEKCQKLNKDDTTVFKIKTFYNMNQINQGQTEIFKLSDSVKYPGVKSAVQDMECVGDMRQVNVTVTSGGKGLSYVVQLIEEVTHEKHENQDVEVELPEDQEVEVHKDQDVELTENQDVEVELPQYEEVELPEGEVDLENVHYEL